MTDCEAAAAHSPSTVKTGMRSQLFVIFGLASMTWCCFLLYMMHGLSPTALCRL